MRENGDEDDDESDDCSSSLTRRRRFCGFLFRIDGLLDAAFPEAIEDGAGVVFTRNVVGHVQIDGVRRRRHRTRHPADARMLRLQLPLNL